MGDIPIAVLVGGGVALSAMLILGTNTTKSLIVGAAAGGATYMYNQTK